MAEKYAYYEEEGDNRLKLGDKEGALKNYDSAIELFPYNDGIWVKKGNILASMKRFDEAIECYNTALYVNPNREKAWHAKGLALHFLKRFDEAIECFDKAIEIHPDYDTTWHAKGVALYLMDRYEEALRHFQRALDIYPLHKNAQKFKEECIAKLKEKGVSPDTILSAATRTPKVVAERGKKGPTIVSSRAKELQERLEKGVGREETEEQRREREQAEKIVLDAQNLVTYLERMGIQIRESRDMLIEAVASFESGEYTDASEFGTKSIKIGEKVKSYHKRAVETVSDVWNRVREIINIGAQCPETDALLDIARDNIKSGKVEKALEYAKRAEESIATEEESVLKDMAREKLDRMRNRFKDLKDFYPDGDYRDIEKHLLGIDATIIEGNYRRAIDLLNRAEESIDDERFRAKRRVINQEINITQTLLMDAKELMAGHEENIDASKDFVATEDILSRGREAYQEERYDEALDLARKAKESARSVKRFVESEMGDYLQARAARLVKDLESNQVRIDDELKSMMNRAERAKKDSIYLHSIELGKQILGELEDLHEEHFKKKAEDRLAKVDRIIANARKAGVRVDEAAEKADDIRKDVAEGRYKSALSSLDAISTRVEEIKGKSLMNLAVEEMQRVNNDLGEADTIGIDVGGIRETMDKAKTSYDRGEYPEALEYVNLAEETLDMRRERYDSVIRILAECGNDIEDAEKMGLKTADLEEARKMKFEAERALAEKDISGSKDLAEKARDHAEKLKREEMKRRALDKMTSVPNEIRDLEKLAVDIQGLNSLFEEARMSYEGGRIEEAYQLVNRVEELTLNSRKEALSMRAKDRINHVQGLQAEALERNIKSDTAVEEIASAQEALVNNDFEEVEKHCDRAEQELNRARMKGMVTQATDKLLEVGGKIKSLSSMGINTSEARDLFDRAKKLVSDERYGKAIEELEDVESILGNQQWRYNKLKDDIAQLEKNVEDVDLGDSEEKVRDMLAKTKTSFHGGDYTLAEALVNKLKNTMASHMESLKRERTEERLNKLKDGLQMLRKNGYDSPEIYNTLRSAQQAFYSNDLEECDSVLDKGLEKLEEEQDKVLTRIALDTIARVRDRIDERSSRGKDVGKARMLVEDAMRAVEIDRYEKAINLCGDAEDEIEEAVHSETSSGLEERISKIKDNIRVINSGGGAVSESIQNLVSQAEDSLAKREYEKVSDRLEKAEAALGDEARRMKRQKALDLLIEAQGTLEDDVISRAKSSFENEDYDTAIDLLSSAEPGKVAVQEKADTDLTSSPLNINIDVTETKEPPVGEPVKPSEVSADSSGVELHKKLARASLDEARKLGLKTSHEKEAIKMVDKLASQGKTKEAEDMAKEARDRLEDSIVSFNQIRKVVSQEIRPRFDDLRSMGVNTVIFDYSVNESLRKARGLDFLSATRLLDSNAEAIAALRTGDEYSASTKLLGNLEEHVEDIRKEGLLDGEKERAISEKIRKIKELHIEGKYKEAVNLMGEVCDILIGKRRGSTRNEARARIKKAEDMISKCRDLGLDVFEAENLLRRAREGLEAENFERAMDDAEAALDAASDRSEVKEKEMAQRSLERVENALDEIRDNPNMAQVRQSGEGKLEEIRTLFQGGLYGQVSDRCSEIMGDIRNAESISAKQDMDKEIQDLKAEIKGYVKDDILPEEDEKEVEKLLKQAETASELNQVEDTLSYLMKAKDALEKKIGDVTSKSSEDALISAKGVIQEADNFGINVEEARKVMDQAKRDFSGGRYAKALKQARKAKKMALNQRQECEETLEIISEINPLLEEMENTGVSVSNVRSVLKQAKDYIKRDMYAEALEQAKKARDEMDELSFNRDKAVEVIGRIQSKFTDLKKSSIDVDTINGMIEELSRHMRKGDYETVVKKAEDFNRAVNELIAYNDQYKQSLAETKSRINSLKSSGAVVDQPAKDTKEAIDLAKTGEFEAAIIMLKNAGNELEKIESNFKSAKSVIDDVRKKLVEARKKGINIKEAEDRFNNVIKHMNQGDYEQAKKDANEALKAIIAESLQRIAGE